MDLTGLRFGRLTVLGYAFRKNGYAYWLCKCDCGKEKTVLSGNLTSHKTQSCGCLQKERASAVSKRHGGSGTRLYAIWKGMKSRCENRNTEAYKDYGGRGVCVCQEWRRYETFRDWALANGYQDGLTIERKDVDGMYEPTNCEWIPLPDQGKNTRRTHYIEYDGRKMSLVEWSKELGGGPNLVTTRLQRGWSERDAVTKPPIKR